MKGSLGAGDIFSWFSVLNCRMLDIIALCWRSSLTGVEFGARMITIDGKQIKLQIWDTVSVFLCFFFFSAPRHLSDV